MAAGRIIQIWRQDALLSEHTWRLLRTSHRKDHQWQTVDCVISNSGNTRPVGDVKIDECLDDLRVIAVDREKPSLLDASSFGDNEAYQFLVQTLLTRKTQGKERLIKFIIPTSSGFIVRSDIIPLRLHDCLRVEQARSFAKPLQSYKVEHAATFILNEIEPSLPDIFTIAAGCVLANLVQESDLEAVSSELDRELDNRLSFPWIVFEEAKKRTLALVEANSSHPEDGIGFYSAARALGVNLVVLDDSGHWLESPDAAHMREAFIPTKLTNPPQADMKDNILQSLKAYGKPVDGIVTFADTYWPYVAEAAKVLGLPTASPEGFRTATNKYLTSTFAGHEAYHASSLSQVLEIAAKPHLPYPLIIKPCGGWSSEGVYRIDSSDGLEEAARLIIASRHGSELVIEPYCDGPEVDVNLVLQDGELLFFEVCDDLPKSADVNGPRVGSLNNFHELCSVYPSNLPDVEIEILRRSFVDTLLSLGLRSGVMHLEGRMENSTVEYTTRDGIIELQEHSKDSHAAPKAWLIEINPRPLGMTGSQIIESTYGIDYWGLAVLSAVGDKTRVRALSQAYMKGPQYTSVMVFIPADFSPSCKGIFDSDDICKDLMIRRPRLKNFISRCGCLVKRGQRVPHPNTGRNSFVAYFNVFSRNSRKEALRIAQEVREEVRYNFV